MNDHETFLLLAAKRLDQALTSEEETLLEAHLASCPSCRAIAAGMRRDDLRLRASLTPVPVPRRVRDRVLAEASGRRVVGLRTALLLAAALALGLIGAPLIAGGLREIACSERAVRVDRGRQPHAVDLPIDIDRTIDLRVGTAAAVARALSRPRAGRVRCARQRQLPIQRKRRIRWLRGFRTGSPSANGGDRRPSTARCSRTEVPSPASSSTARTLGWLDRRRQPPTVAPTWRSFSGFTTGAGTVKATRRLAISAIPGSL